MLKPSAAGLLSRIVKPGALKISRKLAATVIVIVCAISTGALWLPFRSGQSKGVKWVSVRNAAFQDQFAVITRGTNHVVFRKTSVTAKLLRNPPLHWFERWFPGRVRALSSGIASIHTPSNSTVLWLGWTSQLTQPLCLLTDSGGRIVPLQILTGPWGQPEYPGFHVQPFEVPSTLGNVHGDRVHVYIRSAGIENDAGTLQLP